MSPGKFILRKKRRGKEKDLLKHQRKKGKRGEEILYDS